MCVHAHVDAQVCAAVRAVSCVHMRVWRPKINLGVIPQVLCITALLSLFLCMSPPRVCMPPLCVYAPFLCVCACPCMCVCACVHACVF